MIIRLESAVRNSRTIRQEKEKDSNTRQSREVNGNHHTHKTSSNQNKRKVVILRDSLLKDFSVTNFSSAFNTEVMAMGSYKDLNLDFRRILSKPNVDCYVLELGINDLRSNSVDSVFVAARETINRLLDYTNAKILVSLIIPTTNRHNLNRKVEDLYNKILKYLSYLRYNNGLNDRVFTNFNASFLKKPLKDIENCYVDGLHLSTMGLKKLCNNIKRGLYKSFNMTFTRRPHQTTLSAYQ